MKELYLIFCRVLFICLLANQLSSQQDSCKSRWSLGSTFSLLAVQDLSVDKGGSLVKLGPYVQFAFNNKISIFPKFEYTFASRDLSYAEGIMSIGGHVRYKTDFPLSIDWIKDIIDVGVQCGYAMTNEGLTMLPDGNWRTSRENSFKNHYFDIGIGGLLKIYKGLVGTAFLTNRFSNYQKRGLGTQLSLEYYF